MAIDTTGTAFNLFLVILTILVFLIFWAIIKLLPMAIDHVRHQARR